MGTPSNLARRADAVISVNQSIYEESSTQLSPLGTRIQVGEREFTYMKAGVALLPGEIVAAPIPTAVMVGPHKATLGAAVVAGTYQVKVFSATAVTASVFDEGYFIVADSGTQGHCYKVAKQPAISSAGSSYVTLYDPIQTALTVTAKGTLLTSQYYNVTNLIDATAKVVGVCPAVVSAGNYFFGQVKGPAAVKVANTNVIPGTLMVPSTTGGFTVCDVTANSQVIGVCAQTGTAYDSVGAYLNIE